MSYGVVFLCVWFLFSKMDGAEDGADALALITWGQVVVICVLGVVNLGTNLPPIVIALPGLRGREAAVTNTASAALSNTVPEGGAIATGLNFAMLRSWGFALDDITAEVLVTGTWSQVTKFSLLAASLAAVAYQGTGPAGTGAAAAILTALVIAALVLVALILRSQGFAERLGRWTDAIVAWLARLFRRKKAPTPGSEIPRFRTLTIDLIRYCWHRLTIAMLVSQLTACFVLGAACRMQGLGEDTISWATIILAYGAVTLASLLVPTPGGLGVAEIVLVGVLGYGLPQSDQVAVLAAVVLYRIATFLVPIPIGLVTYLYWRKSDAWRRPVDSRPVALATVQPH
jgi:putative heme transporter